MGCRIPAALAAAIRGCAPLGHIYIAFSGGLDSRFLAFAAKAIGITPHLFHISGPHISGRESREALAWAAGLGASAAEIPCDPTRIPEIAQAGTARCYACKKALFSSVLSRIPQGAVLCDGTNASDAGTYRPGMKALAELGVRSPLKEAGITKPQIRQIAAAIGMDNPQQAARPCLLTRFPYGALPQRDLMESVARAEGNIEERLPGLRFRIRVPQEGKPVLHAAASTLTPATEVALTALVATLAASDPLLANLAWEPVETLSGYYDRLAGLTA